MPSFFVDFRVKNGTKTPLGSQLGSQLGSHFNKKNGGEFVSK